MIEAAIMMPGVMDQLSQAGADGFICGNDYTAASLMRHLMTRGVRIPEDVRVVGVDDLKYARLLSVPLTMTLKMAIQNDDDTRWIAILIGSERDAEHALAQRQRADD